MITSWMLYGIAVSLLTAIAAFSLERWGQGRRLPIRWIWAGALVTSVLLPIAVMVWRARIRASGSAAIGEMTAVVEEPARSGGAGGLMIEDGGAGLLTQLDPVLALIWVAGSAGLALLAVAAGIRLRLQERSWGREKLAGRSVRVSPDVGPAVVGFVQSRIVVPEWALTAEKVTQELIVAHEEEHIRAWDPQVLLSSFLFLVALPWNLPLWWAVHRLRLAIEIDCDARVLARGADVRTYGSLLLDVSGHRTVGFAPALSNPAAFLERRIRMISRRREESRREPAIALAFAAVLLLVACGLEQPPPPISDSDEPAGTEPSGTEMAGSDTIGTDVAFGPRLIELRLPAADSQPSSPPAPLPPIVQGEGAQPGAPSGPTIGPSPAQGGSEVQVPALAESPVFTPMEVRPELTNRTEFIQQIQRRYPPMLRDAGIGGTVNVWVFINEQGAVQNARIQESSGYPQLDDAAESLMREEAEFAPAMNRGQSVPVWISIPVTFESRQ